ncbi:hypothetical protein, partial [uncultured Stutzerimonas sp.]|uniref:hypothetical protein n=1 Tax=uncultured Stutzerimonas sp. TaxID=2901168 RepID=UPI0032B2CC42
VTVATPAPAMTPLLMSGIVCLHGWATRMRPKRKSPLSGGLEIRHKKPGAWPGSVFGGQFFDDGKTMAKLPSFVNRLLILR